MSTDNNLLKTLLLEAYDAFRVKIEALDVNDPAVAQLNNDLKAAFDKFSIEGIWVHPITFDEVRLLKYVFAIRALENASVADCRQQADQVIHFLETEVLKDPLQWLTEASTSDWNVKMLEALRKLRATITRKKNALAAAGKDPMDNQAFRKEDERFNKDVEIYRAKLKANEVNTDESDLKTVGFLDQMIGAVSAVAKFVDCYKLLNEFVAKKIQKA